MHHAMRYLSPVGELHLLADEELPGVGVRHRVAGGCCLGGKRGRKKQKDSRQEVQGLSHG